MHTVDSLFTMVIYLADNFRRKFSDGNGRELYNWFNTFFQQVEGVGEWNSVVLEGGKVYERNQFVLNDEEYPEWHEDGTATRNHFARQLLQIPRDKPAEFYRLMQAALNVGQYLGSNELIDGFYLGDFLNVEYFMEKKVWDNFVFPENFYDNFLQAVREHEVYSEILSSEEE